MTYQERFKVLQDDLTEKAIRFRKLEDKILHVNSFGDQIELKEYLKAQHAHLVAANTFNNFLADCIGKNINPDDEYKV